MNKKREFGLIKSYKLKNFAKVLAGFFLFFAASLFFYFFETSAANSGNNVLSPGQIILGKAGEDHRIFIQMEKDGYYLVQNIGADGIPLTNPYRIKNKEDLTNFTENQKSIDGLYVTYDFASQDGGRFYRNFVLGLEEGDGFSILKDGSIGKKVSYRNGKPLSIVFYFKNGDKRAESLIMNNGTETKTTMWWRNGKKIYEQEAKDGEFNYQKSWYQNGAKRAELNEKHGKERGKSWHENGKIATELEIDNSKVIKCIEYNESGKIISNAEASISECNEIKLLNFRYPFRDAFAETELSDDTH
jgi:antitoxin component YwqK of YwqJK toxin-antitoxin module